MRDAAVVTPALEEMLRSSSHCLRRSGERPERIVVRRAGDSALGENSGDVPRRGDVESRMRGVDVRRDAHALKVRDFGGGALLNGNVLAIRNG